MKKIKCKSDVYDFLDKEMGWRRKEILEIKNILLNKQNSKEAEVLSKSVILISYSHWEGYVKKSSEAYLNYIKRAAPSANKLSNRILASFIMNVNEAESKYKHIGKLLRILDSQNDPINFNISKMIDPKSNLNSDILDCIMCNLGIESEIFETKKHYIDEKLLGQRNKFAHGEDQYSEITEATGIAATVIELMDNYKTLIENSLCCDNHLKNYSATNAPR